MLYVGRLIVSHASCLQSRAAMSVIITGLMTAGCSADFTRIQAPALGLGAISPKQANAPVLLDGSLFDQQPETGRFPETGRLPAANRTPEIDGRSSPQKNETLLGARKKGDGAPLLSQPRRYADASGATGSYVDSASPFSYAPPSTLFEDEGERSSERSGERAIIVRSGDTLYGLSRRHGVRVSDIKRANALTSNIIRPGQRLYLTDTRAKVGRRFSQPDHSGPRADVRSTVNPDSGLSTSYTVQPGDSLYAISRRTGVSVADLQNINGIRDARFIRKGQVLKLRSDTGRRLQGQPETGGAALGTPSQTNPPTRGNVQQPIMLNPKAGSSRSRSATEVARARIEDASPRSNVGQPQAPSVSSDAADDHARGSFRWPVRGRIIRQFGAVSDGSTNDGINISVPMGTQIHAAEAGVVAYAGDELKGYGNLILVRHEDGYVTAYAHSQEMLVKRGDEVRRGQVIAKAGNTGNVEQPQVHFELRKGAKPVNPVPYLTRL